MLESTVEILQTDLWRHQEKLAELRVTLSDLKAELSRKDDHAVPQEPTLPGL